MDSQESYQLILDKALRLLSFRPRTKKEIRGKLSQMAIKRGIHNDVIDKVLQDLIENKLIDDREFVRWWMTQRDTFRPKGKRLIKIELRNKGVEKEIIDEIVVQKENSRSHEFEMAFSVAQKKLKLYQHLPLLKLKEKLSSHLARRGFDWDTIYAVIDTVIKKG